MRTMLVAMYLAIFAGLFPTSALAGANPAGNDASTSLIARSAALGAELGIRFSADSTTKLVLERDGKKYEVDLAARQIRELAAPATAVPVVDVGASRSISAPQSSSSNQQSTAPAARREGYIPGDDYLFTVPTGRPITRHTWSINFSHRLPYEAAFTGRARGATLLGLDDFAIPSFGLQYGLTNRLSVSAYRSPSIIARPIELGIRYNFLDENHGPFNAAARFSVDGQDNFARNYTTNFELVASRSLGHRAQFYAVPTFSLHNRPVLSSSTALTAPHPEQPCSQLLANGISASFAVHPCENTFSVGVGVSIDLRKTVALVLEAIPTAVNGTGLGIHRVPFSFGIQKKIYHHAFTLGLTTAPGTDTAQRIGTRATFLGDQSADTPSGMFLGFDITRQIP